MRRLISIVPPPTTIVFPGQGSRGTGRTETVASADRIVCDARRASAQCGCQKLILGDVMLVLVKPADETVHLPESSEHLLITEQSPS